MRHKVLKNLQITRYLTRMTILKSDNLEGLHLKLHIFPPRFVKIYKSHTEIGNIKHVKYSTLRT